MMELRIKGYEVTFVHQIFKNSRKLSIYMLTLKETSENKAIFHEHELFYI